jgi:hypothetical protein
MTRKIFTIAMIAWYLTGPAAGIAFADPPISPPPMPREGHGLEDNQHAAPIDGGFGIIFFAAALYASGKIYKHKKTEKQEVNPG